MTADAVSDLDLSCTPPPGSPWAAVVLVMTHRNAPRLNPAPAFLAAEKGAAGDDLPIMQAVR